MVQKIVVIAFVLIFTVIVTGCVGNGDISTAIDKWNKVADKTQEIRLVDEQFEKMVSVDIILLESEIAKDNPNVEKMVSILDKWQKTIDEEKRLLEDESNLISEYAGATVNLGGDAKKYADNALYNIRESHRYATSSNYNYEKGLESLKMYYETFDDTYYTQYEQYFNMGDSDITKHGLYMDKTNDDISKLEALQ